MNLIDEAESLLSTATDGAYSTDTAKQPSDRTTALKMVLLAKHSQTLVRIHKSIDSIRKDAERGRYEAARLAADKIYPAIMEFCTITEIKITVPSESENRTDDIDEMESILNSKG